MGEDSNTLSRTDAVVITAVVCVLCGFTAGLLVGGVLTQCCGKRWKYWQKTGQIEKYATDYENPNPNQNNGDIEIQRNEAYRHLHKL